MENDTLIMGNKISEGGYGIVYHCMFKNEQSAIKISKMGGRKQMHHEITLLKDLDNIYIVKPLFVIYEPTSVKFIMKFGGNDLFYFVEEKILKFQEKYDILCQLIYALEHIHSKKICHRDLKLENILYDGKKITIIDFGLSYKYISILLKHLQIELELYHTCHQRSTIMKYMMDSC